MRAHSDKIYATIVKSELVNSIGCKIDCYVNTWVNLKPRSHEGLGPCCDLCKTSHVVKSQVDLIRARDRS